MLSAFTIQLYSNEGKKLTGFRLALCLLSILNVSYATNEHLFFHKKWLQGKNQNQNLYLELYNYTSSLKKNFVIINRLNDDLFETKHFKDGPIYPTQLNDEIESKQPNDRKYSNAQMSTEENVSFLSNGSDKTVPDDSSRLYEIPVSLTVLLSVLYTSVSLIAVFGNLMVFYIVLISKRMRNVTNLFIANLALADILIGALSIPMQFISALLQRWFLPEFLCPVCPAVQVISLNVSIFTLTAIAIDRHRAITKPLANKLTKFKANIIIILIWCFSLFLAVPTFLSWNIRYIIKDSDNQIDYKQIDQASAANQSSESSKLSNSVPPLLSDLNITNRAEKLYPFCDVYSDIISDELRKLYHQILVCVQFLIPLFIISFTYVHMAIKLNSEDMSTNARNDCQRALQVKKRV